MSKKVVVNIDDFCDNEWAIVDLLSSLRENYPNFKATLFTIPFKTSSSHLLALKNMGWMEVAVHGLNHAPREMLALRKEDVVKGFSQLDFSLFAKGFRAPYWLMNEEVIECCNEFEMWLAIHHIKNDASWKNLAKYGYYYPIDTEENECWYAHTYNIADEFSGLLKKWPAEQEFAFVSEAVRNEYKAVKLNFGIGFHPLGGFINLENNKKYVKRSRSPECEIVECDLRDGLGMFGNDSVDAATASHTLMYLKEKEEYPKFIAEVYRVLKKKGVFRVTEDNCESSSPGLPHPDKISVTGPKMMRVELEKAGFEVRDVSPKETSWIDGSLIQQFHGDPPRVFHMEGIKRRG